MLEAGSLQRELRSLGDVTFLLESGLLGRFGGLALVLLADGLGFRSEALVLAALLLGGFGALARGFDPGSFDPGGFDPGGLGFGGLAHLLQALLGAIDFGDKVEGAVLLVLDEQVLEALQGSGSRGRRTTKSAQGVGGTAQRRTRLAPFRPRVHTV